MAREFWRRIQSDDCYFDRGAGAEQHRAFVGSLHIQPTEVEGALAESKLSNQALGVFSIFAPPHFWDTDETSDHRPVAAVVELPVGQ